MRYRYLDDFRSGRLLVALAMVIVLMMVLVLLCTLTLVVSPVLLKLSLSPLKWTVLFRMFIIMLVVLLFPLLLLIFVLVLRWSSRGPPSDLFPLHFCLTASCFVVVMLPRFSCLLVSRETGFDSLAKLASWLRMEVLPPILAVTLVFVVFLVGSCCWLVLVFATVC